MFGFHRKVRYIDAVQDAVPGALLPPRELLRPPARRRYTLVREVDKPHENAVPFYNIAPIPKIGKSVPIFGDAVHVNINGSM